MRSSVLPQSDAPVEPVESPAVRRERAAAGEVAAIAVKRALVVLNPVAGRTAREDVLATLDQVLTPAGWEYRVHELEEDEPPARIDAVLQEAARDGRQVVVAAGGDGTVSYVADAILRNGLSASLYLGILPAGTANLLAGELGIPDDLTEAAQLIASEFSCATIDAMRIGSKHYFLRVGVGLDAITVRDTTREAKRWFGKLAYAGTFIKTLAGYGSHRFVIDLDGRRSTIRAWQATVANGGFVGMKPIRLGPDISPSDRRLNLCLYAVHRWLDIPRLFWKLLTGRYDQPSNMRYFTVAREVTIESRPRLPVQADGEPIGETPVTVTVVPGALRLVHPCGPGAMPEVGGAARTGST